MVGLRRHYKNVVIYMSLNHFICGSSFGFLLMKIAHRTFDYFILRYLRGVIFGNCSSDYKHSLCCILLINSRWSDWVLDCPECYKERLCNQERVFCVDTLRHGPSSVIYDEYICRSAVDIHITPVFVDHHSRHRQSSQRPIFLIHTTHFSAVGQSSLNLLKESMASRSTPLPKARFLGILRNLSNEV